MTGIQESSVRSLPKKEVPDFLKMAQEQLGHSNLGTTGDISMFTPMMNRLIVVQGSQEMRFQKSVAHLW